MDRLQAWADKPVDLWTAVTVSGAGYRLEYGDADRLVRRVTFRLTDVAADLGGSPRKWGPAARLLTGWKREPTTRRRGSLVGTFISRTDVAEATLLRGYDVLPFEDDVYGGLV